MHVLQDVYTMQAIEIWNITPRPPSVHAVITRVETAPDIYDHIARFWSDVCFYSAYPLHGSTFSYMTNRMLPRA